MVRRGSACAMCRAWLTASPGREADCATRSALRVEEGGDRLDASSHCGDICPWQLVFRNLDDRKAFDVVKRPPRGVLSDVERTLQSVSGVGAEVLVQVARSCTCVLSRAVEEGTLGFARQPRDRRQSVSVRAVGVPLAPLVPVVQASDRIDVDEAVWRRGGRRPRVRPVDRLEGERTDDLILYRAVRNPPQPGEYWVVGFQPSCERRNPAQAAAVSFPPRCRWGGR